jgi:hypothetical protein
LLLDESPLSVDSRVAMVSLRVCLSVAISFFRALAVLSAAYVAKFFACVVRRVSIWLTHMDQKPAAQAAPPSHCTQKRRFFGGSGERPHASCLGSRRNTSTTQPAGSHAGLWKKKKFKGQVKNFVSCPSVPLCIDSRGRELPHLCHFRSQLQTLPTR